MKSGTNWICRLLNQHPDVHCVGEFHWETLYRAFQQNVDRIAPRRRSQLQGVVGPHLQQLVRNSLIDLSGRTSPVIGDRTPTTIDPVILPVPHVVMIRDFRDVIVSRMFHLFNNPRVTGIFNRDPVMANRLQKYQDDCWYFKDNPEQLLDCEEIVCDSAREWSQHLQSDRLTSANHPELPVLFIQYEDLHREFEQTCGSVFQFLDLDHPDIDETLQPGHATENPSSLDRKGQIGDWNNYANEQVLSWIEKHAGSTLNQFGYRS